MLLAAAGWVDVHVIYRLSHVCPLGLCSSGTIWGKENSAGLCLVSSSTSSVSHFQVAFSQTGPYVAKVCDDCSITV